MPRRLPLPLAIAGACLALAGCLGSSSDPRTINDSTFVATMADLRRIGADTTLDSMAQDSARRVILRTRGLTADELERAARALAEDPEHAIAVWQAIQRRVDATPSPTAP